MKREGHIYSVFAIGGALLLAYSLSLLSPTWSRFGWSLELGAIFVLVLVFAGLSSFYLWLSILFNKRAVAQIFPVAAGYELRAAEHSGFPSEPVASLRLLRRIGAQFTSDELKPKFVVFTAAGKHWVAAFEDFEAAKAEAFKAEA